MEVSFESESEDKSQDRIDLLLYHLKKRKLKFYEAKDFTNSEIRAESGKKPKVVSQISRYRKQLDSSVKRAHIIEQYGCYIKIINELFLPDYPIERPTEIDPEPCLLIFGFDDDQRKGRLKKNVETLRSYGIKVYTKGDMSKVKIEQLWNAK